MAHKKIRKNKQELEQLKRLAYEWFMNTDKTQKEIADIIGVSEVTMSKWVADGNWDEIKALETASRGATIRNLLKRIFEESQKEDPDADKIAKLTSALEKLDQKKITVPNTINIFMAFGKWLYPRNPEQAKQFTMLMNDFIKEKIEE